MREELPTGEDQPSGLDRSLLIDGSPNVRCYLGTHCVVLPRECCSPSVVVRHHGQEEV